MIISKVSNFNITRPMYQNYSTSSNYNSVCLSANSGDTFLKTNNDSKVDSVSFTARFISNEFETRFNKNFFKKILREDITDAYTGMRMVSREDYDHLRELGVLNKKSQLSIKALKMYKDCMFSTEKKVFVILENLAKKHPNMNLQELLGLRYEKAEESLINHQAEILDKINLIGRKLPRAEYINLRKLIQGSFDRIFDPEVLPETRFSRKRFIAELKKVEISDPKRRERIMKVAEKLPRASDSVNAFIVKYSQPYKIKYTSADGDFVRIPRTSEDVGLRLLEPSIATAEHIYPQTKYSQEEKEMLEQGLKTEEIKQMRVSILTSKGINEIKSDTPFDDFVKSRPEQIADNIDMHVQKLKLLAMKWKKDGRYEDASTLADYIVLLRDEFAKRSKLITIDISDFEGKVAEYRDLFETSVAMKKNKKRVKKTGHADNSHRETYIGPNGVPVKNRKVQKHSPRF